MIHVAMSYFNAAACAYLLCAPVYIPDCDDARSPFDEVCDSREKHSLNFQEEIWFYPSPVGL